MPDSKMTRRSLWSVISVTNESESGIHHELLNAAHTKPNQELRYVIGRGLALTGKQMLSPTDQRGTRRHAVADSQRADSYADAYQNAFARIIHHRGKTPLSKKKPNQSRKVR